MKVIKPKVAKEAETRQTPAKPKPKTKTDPAKKASDDTQPDLEGLTARERAKVLAATKYGSGVAETTTPTAAERRKQRRETHVPFTCELPVDHAAKLLALAKANSVTQVAVIRDLIEKAKLPR